MSNKNLPEDALAATLSDIAGKSSETARPAEPAKHAGGRPKELIDFKRTSYSIPLDLAVAMDIEADIKHGGNCSVMVRRMLNKSLDQDLLSDVREILKGLDTKALGNNLLKAVTEELNKKGRLKEIA